MSAPSRRLLLVSDFNLENLKNCLAANESEPAVVAECAPFGEVFSVLLDSSSKVWRDSYDAVFVWTRPQSAVPAFQEVLDYHPLESSRLEREVDQFAECIAGLSDRARSVFVASWSLPPARHGLGLREFAPGGAAFELSKINVRLAERLARDAGCYLLDSWRWLESAGGASAYSSKLWGLTKTPYHIKCFQHAAEDLKAAMRAVLGRGRKLLVLDLDDTLWGGIVGEVGWRNLRLGGHDPIGEAFVEFQQTLKALRQRGVVLAVVSKNNEAIALEAIDEHPAMVLRRDDFVSWRINWEDKAANIADLAAELNLGLDSVVFIDDNPSERSRVRTALPMVLVPEWPKDKTQYTVALHALNAFDTAHMTAEDRARTELYAAERKRQALKTAVTNVAEWLRTLEISAKVESLHEGNLKRAAQLLNKTNQMNLRTRRLTESEFFAWSQAAGKQTWCFTIADRFGEAGLTGLASLEFDGESCRVIDFILSCRVFGRGIERAMLAYLVGRARAVGANRLEAEYLPTEKNSVCREFWNESGFTGDGSGRRFTWDLSHPFAGPECVRLIEPSQPPARRAA